MSDNNTLTIEDDYSSWNGIRQIYFQCQHVDHYPASLAYNGLSEEHRCGGDSMYLVTYHTASGTKISKHLCERHTNELIEQANNKGYEIARIK
jgi:hypothetical protein